MADPNTLAQFMSKMPEAFQCEKAGDTKAVIKIELSGEGGGVWTVNVGNGQCTVTPDGDQPAQATISASADDFLALMQGQLNPVSAFMMGKIRVTGDMALVMKFQQWFGR